MVPRNTTVFSSGRMKAEARLIIVDADVHVYGTRVYMMMIETMVRMMSSHEYSNSSKYLFLRLSVFQVCHVVLCVKGLLVCFCVVVYLGISIQLLTVRVILIARCKYVLVGMALVPRFMVTWHSVLNKHVRRTWYLVHTNDVYQVVYAFSQVFFCFYVTLTYR